MAAKRKTPAGKHSVRNLGGEHDEVRRAFAAWFRSAGREAVPEQPLPTSAMYEHAGKRYVRLEGTNGTLVIYRVRNDKMLKRMRRWPKALDAAWERG